MAIENKRVIDLANESTSLAGDEYVLLDSNNTGTTKYRLSRLSDQIEGVDEAVQTEATARANAVTAEATARQTADTALEGEITNLKDDLSDLESDGVVASAEQLLSDKYVIDQVPYHYRASGGNGADREYDEIVGGSVVWNQTVKDPLLTDTSKIHARNATFTVSDGVATCTPTSDGTEIGLTFACDDFVYGHKYFIGAMVKPSVSGTMAVGASGNAHIPRPSITANVWQLVAVIYNRIITGTANLVSFYQYNSITTNDTIQYKNPQCIDLTAMFGTTVADYIYNLEQSSAGAGVAFFKTLFPNDYYEYNAGSMEHVSGISAHEMVGFNQCDEEWESGYINDNGEDVVNTKRIRSKNYIPCTPDAQYYFECGSQQSWYQIAFYDSSKTYINHLAPNTNALFTTPSNARYMRFATNDGYGTTYKNDICINISSDRNGEYEPYVKHSYPLDSSLTLRGIPKLDASNNLYYDGDTYAADGTVTRKYGVRAYQEGDESLADAITDGMNTVYKLTTPTTETAEPFTNLQKVDPYGTEEYVTTSIVPVGHYTKYPENLRAKIEGLPTDFITLIADTEKTTTASKNYAVGDYLIYNNQLYKVTSAIASGATITVGTNVTATTIMAEIKALQ